jgi:hypothetical protein
LSISRTIGDRAKVATMLNNMGKVYISSGEIQKALEKHDEALLIFRAIGERINEALTLLRIADVEQKRDNLTQARLTVPISNYWQSFDQ